jgi:hypothetical protein
VHRVGEVVFVKGRNKMIELDGSHPPRVRLKVGDVVMVHKLVERPRDGSKPFWWKWLGTVVQIRKHRIVKVIRFGADAGKDVIDFHINSIGDTDNMKVWFIPEEEWPDGVHAFRTRLILEGRLDEAAVG